MSLSTQTTFDSHSTLSSDKTQCIFLFPKADPVHSIITFPSDEDYCEDCHGELSFITLFPCYYCGILICEPTAYLCTHCATSDSDTSESSTCSYVPSDSSEDPLSQVSERSSSDRSESQNSSSEYIASSEESSQSTHEDSDGS